MSNLNAATDPPSFVSFSQAITPATSGNYRLRFHGNNPVRYLYVDNVSLAVTAVPEVSTLAMMLAGLGAVAWVAPRRRQRR